MPAWLASIIQFVIQVGIPDLENLLPAGIVQIIQQIIGFLTGSANQGEALKKLSDHLTAFFEAEKAAKLKQ